MKSLALISLFLIPVILKSQDRRSIDSVARQTSFSLLLDGGIRDIGSQTTNVQAATGKLGFEFDNEDLDVKASWVLASNTSEISPFNSEYGKTLLNPNIGTPNLGFNIDITKAFLFHKKGLGKYLLEKNRYDKKIGDSEYALQLASLGQPKSNILHKFLGGGFRVNVNQTAWSTKDTAGSITKKDMGILYYGLNAMMTHHIFLTNTGLNSNLKFSYGVGITGRWLFGDAAADDDFLNRTIGGTTRVFTGVEILSKFQYSNFYAEFSLPIFKGQVSGFSNGHVIINIGIAAKIGGEWRERGWYPEMIDKTLHLTTKQ